MTYYFLSRRRLAALALAVFATACQRQMLHQNDNSPSDVVARQATSVNGPGVFDRFTYLVNIVHTLAGTSFPGFVDGKDFARFDGPAGLAMDASGNIYIADRLNNRIRKMAPDGTVSTFAGSFFGGFKDGPAAEAQFNGPMGVAIDSRGYLYVADMLNNRIRKISPDGIVSTLAGTGAAGFSDGPGNVARFKNPIGVAVDAAGVVYVADAGNNRIRRISTAGIVNAWVGDGVAGFKDAAGAYAELNFPIGLAIGGAGEVYVADAGNNRVRKIVSGVISTLAGNGEAGDADGTGPGAAFNYPFGVAVDGAGNVLVTDLGSGRVRQVTPLGMVKTMFGTGGRGFFDGDEPVGRMYSPGGIVIDPKGDVIVTDDNAIRKLSAGQGVGTFVGSVPGNQDGTGKNALFYDPSSVKFDAAGNMYVADAGNANIRKVTPGGQSTILAGNDQYWGPHVPSFQTQYDGTGTQAKFFSPEGMAIDATGNVYVCDNSAGEVRKITPAGVTSTVAGGLYDHHHRDGTGPAAGFQFCKDITIDGTGNLFVVDGKYISKIDGNGTAVTITTLPDISTTQIRSMRAIVMAENGNMFAASDYVSQNGNPSVVSEIWKVTPDGHASIFGRLPFNYNANGLTYDPGTKSLYATANSGDIVYNDTAIKSQIVKFDVQGQMSYVAGARVGSADGDVSVGRLGYCWGLTFGPNKALYVADASNSRVRIVGLPK
jgi:sugar lactone lactonase YvrE